MISVSDHKFPDFQPKMSASACYLEVHGHLLLIQQGRGRFEEGLWGVPAGKFEPGETAKEAALRELYEETAIQIKHPSEIRYLGVLYMRKPELDYNYYMYQIHLKEKPPIRLSDEHTDYLWAAPEDLKRLPLRAGVQEALLYYRKKAIT